MRTQDIEKITNDLVNKNSWVRKSLEDFLEKWYERGIMIMYIYKDGKLAAIQEITGWPLRKVRKLISAQIMLGRTFEIKKKEK